MDISKAGAPAPFVDEVEPETQSAGKRAWRRFLRNGGAVIGTAILLFWFIVALISPWIVPYDPTDTLGLARQPPSAEFWFGTDTLGRDVFSRVLVGSQISLQLGLISIALGLVPGVALGLIAGYIGGITDAVLSRLVDAMLAFPSILLALVIIAALGPNLRNVMIAVGIGTVPLYARLVRGSVLSIKQLPYVEAARVLGNPPLRIMLRHVLANAYAPIVVLSTLQVGHAILIGSGLSFLGLGAQPPTPEWGLMSAEGRDVLRRAWWISTFPGIAILSVVVACNLVGDGLRSALDPRMRIDR
ncbi:MAG: ABC transporter permease [Methylobacterium sp.]|jgi:peptide/nickel transport system permease protein|nr:ABC transporter permease [Methylobacterium sp.]MCA3602358.1 ABC transporter permease [Methylobacterium sp.]MCA3610937.1 ABC transporter permease [Methylobacterium sp.]MCA3613924.1 ABC transporter permease [Methylobacterium sp.]MCA3622559.1 ABC transporter permease [Methylobacterium sp.]